jgi:hypothetical protein
MSIFDSKTRAQLRETIKQKETIAAELKKMASITDERDGLQARIGAYKDTQELLVKDILSLQEIGRGYKGNEYQDYQIAVQAISDKYNSLAEWGCLQTGAVIDLRAAFILGDGLKVVHKTETKEEAVDEIDWAKRFLEYNGLESEMAQELAKEAEIEGKIALRLFWDNNPKDFADYGKDPAGQQRPGMVSVRFLSWLSKKYIVEVDPNDYLWYKRLSWPAGSTSTPRGYGSTGNTLTTAQTYPAGFVDEPEFVYKKFGGRINDANAAQPKVMKCLTQIDRLDKALRDLREINHLFASPTPDFKVGTAQEATQLLAHLENANWKIGKAIAHVGDFAMISPDSAGVTNLIAEIELNVKMISGTTGVPIHYLGLLDLLKNRATGDNTRELVMAATTRERMIWVGAFEELIDKAMAMYNQKSGLGQKTTKLDPEKIGVEIPVISQDQWTNIEKVLIPAALGGIISKEYVAGQIPGVDMEEEAKKQQAAASSDLEQAKLDLERMRQDAASKTIVAGGGGA